MENKGYLIYEVGILGGNDKVKTNLFVLFVLNFIKDGKKFSFGYFKALGKEDYSKLSCGDFLKISLSKT